MRAPAAPAALAALAALAVGVAGCELTTVDVTVPEELVVVEAYLRADVASQEVFLYRTLPGGNDSLRVDDAEVRVLDGGGAALPFTLSDSAACGQVGDGGSCYTSPSDPGFVRAGRSYTLEVRLADGRELTGGTTVPGAFEVVTPRAPMCVLEGASLPLVWTRSEGAWAYQIMADFRNLAPGLREQGVVDPPDELQLVGLSVGSADTTIEFPGEFGVFDRFSVERELLLALAKGLPRGSRADIVFAAGDANFVNWVRGGNFNPSGQVRVPSVAGDGTGVFASLVVDRRTLVAEDNGSGLPICQ